MTILHKNWDFTFMDYMEGIPSPKHGNDCVSLFINQPSKMSILATYKKSIMVEAIASLFF